MQQPVPLTTILMLWLFLMGWLLPQAGSAQPPSPAILTANAALKRAFDELVAMPGGPPGAIALVQRGTSITVHAAGFGHRDFQRNRARRMRLTKEQAVYAALVR